MMDFLEILKVDYENIDIFKVWTEFVLWRSNAEVFLISATAFLISALIVWYVMKRRKLTLMQQKKIFNSEIHSDLEMRGLRFRKRDKMLFYGRRMLRKVKTVSGQVYGGQGRKRRAVVRFAKKFLHLRRENIPHEMKTVEPPPEYLQEAKDGENRVPPDALYMLQSIRIFGHFEKPVFLKLCKNTEILNLEPGDCLFKITDADDSVYIVQSGQINVFISNADGSTLSLKTVRKGESVTSLLSFIDVLSGNPSYYKTVTAKAMEKSQVIRLPMMAFQEVFDENSDMMIRVIQVIMVRLQRVLFTALRSYLGLTSELMQNHMRTKKCVGNPNVHQNAQQGQQGLNLNSPSRRSQNDSNNYEVPDMLADCYDSHHQWSPLANNNPPFPTAGGGNTSQNTHVGNLSTRRYSITPAEQHINAGSIDQKLMRASAVGSFLKELGLPEEDRQFIDKFVEVYEVEAEDVLIREGNREDACVWFVMTGSLSVYQQSVEVSQDQSKQPYDVFVHQVHPGEIVGGLAVLTAEASAYTIIAKQHSRLAVIPREGVYELMRERPKIIVHLGNGVVRRLSPLVRQCDYALDWIFLESGRAVYRQDETSDSTYIVLSGRMRSVITHCNGKKEIVGEFGKGDLVGIVEMITQTTRTTTVMAVRDSELAKLPEGLFNAIKLRYPIVVSKLISLLSHRILGTMESHSKSGGAPLEANPVTHKYSTVALVPVNEDVPLTTFTYELYHSLCAIGPTLRLTSESVCQTLGQNIFEPANEYRLTSWLAQQEDQNIITLYQCDDFLSPWTLRCLRQSDVVLIVGLGEHLPTVGQFEREIDRMAVRTQKELVLLYNETFTNRPENTLQWLNARPWVTKHHHIKCVRRVFSRKSQFRINDLYSRVLMSQPNMHSDFSRLARWLTGNSIGVVLGGGGARGAAHIGMLKATQEAGIPIDMVGGVSIGALMGALWCAERDITTVTHKAREWSKLMTKWYLQLFDLTYPITSMFSGREFNKTIRNTLGESNIEDLWIPYFTLTTDITASCRRIHTNGSLWRYVRSSMSLSGYMPPLCDPKDGHLLLDGGYVNNLPGHLWRYVRASMSIAGILPPFCDYKDGHLLLDGCYTNNVPADVMRNLGAAHIIAIDVGSQDDTDLTNYGDDLSGWWLLYKKYNPFTSPVKVPDLPDIQSRLAYVSCVRQLEEVKNSDYCEYIRPPIDKYKTLAFGSFDEIRDVGYVFGKNHFELMSKAGRLDRFNQWFNKTPAKKSHNFTLNEYTFIDLAQIVCKVPQTHLEPNSQNYLFSEDEDMDGYISEPSIYRMTPSLKMKRSGTSLSLSENEMDSDVEVDLHLPIKQRAKHLLTPNSISPSRHHSNYPHRNQSKSPKNKCVQVEMSKDDGPNIDEIDTTPKQVTYRHAAQQINRETETTPTNTRSTNGIEEDETQSEVMDQIITLSGDAPLESNQVEENVLETELEKDLVRELVRELVDENSLNDSYAEENEATVEDLKDTSGKTA